MGKPSKKDQKPSSLLKKGSVEFCEVRNTLFHYQIADGRRTLPLSEGRFAAKGPFSLHKW